MRYLILLVCCFALSCQGVKEKKEIQSEQKPELKTEVEVQSSIPSTIAFLSKDGLEITADVYGSVEMVQVLLCHQAGFSRGEYSATGFRLMDSGFSSMAIDQRSGKEANGIANETAKRAGEKGLGTHYLDARQDIEAAIDYLYEKNGGEPLILVGSSYSATLALLIGNKSEKVKAIVAFSPGEYFDGMNIKEEIKSIDKPTFVTSSKKEAVALTEMVSLMNSEILMQFIPVVDGIHGSRALWSSTTGNESYWDALTAFHTKYLEQI